MHSAYVHGREGFLKVFRKYGISVDAEERPRLEQLRAQARAVIDGEVPPCLYRGGRQVTDPEELAALMQQATLIPFDQAAAARADAHVQLTSCANCGKSTKETKRCPCKTVSYCGVACQRAHWKQHKASCTAPRPSSSKD